MFMFLLFKNTADTKESKQIKTEHLTSLLYFKSFSI